MATIIDIFLAIVYYGEIILKMTALIIAILCGIRYLKITKNKD